MTFQSSLDIRERWTDQLDLPALIVDGETWSFRSMIDRVGAALQRWPAGPVALWCAPTIESLTHFYAALAANRPTLLLHPRWSPTQTHEATQAVGARAWFDGTGWIPLEPRAPVELHPRASLLLSTSGSTGAFKIVQHAHATLFASAQSTIAHLPFEPNDRWLLSLPYAHVGGASLLIRCLVAQVPVVVARGSFADPDFIEHIDGLGCSLYSQVPTQLRDLVTYCERLGRRPRLLRRVLVGGAPAPLALRRRAWTWRLGAIYTYGMTEAGSQITTQESTAADEEPRATDVGRPLANVEIDIDPDRRLRVRGPNLMLGYVGSPALREDESGDPPWFTTSDRARLDDDGRLEILGRVDDVLITGGENVDPQSVELILAGAPGVGEVAICGVPDERWGQRLVALVVPSAAHANQASVRCTPPRASLDEILHFARANLPTFAVPKAVVFVTALPRLGIGKLDRKRLPELLHAAVPEPPSLDPA